MEEEYSQLEDRDWLYKKYWEEELSTPEIGKEVGCSESLVRKRMKQMSIQTRSLSEAHLIKPVRYPELLDRKWLYQKYWEEELPPREIAEELGCRTCIVRTRMDELNIQKRTKYPQLRDVDWLREQYVERQLSSYEIADILNCHPSVVWYALNKVGINRRNMSFYLLGNYKSAELHDKAWLIQKYIVDDLSPKEIASILGCHPASINRALRYFTIPHKKEKSEISKELWQDEDFIKKVFAGRYAKPNKFESRIDTVLQQFIPHEWKYNGGLECGIIIGGLVPDFVNINGRKQLIEGFGEPFHGGYFNNSWKRTEFGRKAIFSQFGYETLVLWYLPVQKMSDEEIVEVVREFMKGKAKRKRTKRTKRTK